MTTSDDKTSEANVLIRQQQVLAETAATLAQNVGQLHDAVNAALVVRDELVDLAKGKVANTRLAILAIALATIALVLDVVLFLAR